MPYVRASIHSDLKLDTEVASDVEGGGKVLQKLALWHHIYIYIYIYITDPGAAQWIERGASSGFQDSPHFRWHIQRRGFSGDQVSDLRCGQVRGDGGDKATCYGRRDHWF